MAHSLKVKGHHIQLHMCVCSVISDSLQPHGLQPTRLLCPWDFPSKNTIVGCHFLLQGIFPAQGLNLCLLGRLHWQTDSLPLSHLGSPSLSGLRCMNCPGTTWRMEDMAHFETGQLPKELGKGTELRVPLEGNTNKKPPKHPMNKRERANA